MAKRKRTLQSFSLNTTFVSVVILLLASVLFFSIFTKLIQRENLKNQETSTSEAQLSPPQPPVSMEVQTDSATLNELVKYLQTKEFYNQTPNTFAQRTVEGEDMWWVSPDNWSILGNPAGQVGLVRPEAGKEIKSAGTFTAQLADEIDTFFRSKGFQKSAMNSSPGPITEPNSVAFVKFYDYILGWETKNEKCLLTIDPEPGQTTDEVTKELVDRDTVTIQCMSSDAFQKAYQEQIPFLKAVNDRRAVVRNINAKDEVASMGISGRRSGALLTLYKTSQGWRVISMSQGVESCSEYERDGIPKRYWLACYPSESGDEIQEAGEAWR